MQIDLLTEIEYLLYRDGVFLVKGVFKLDLSVLLPLQGIYRRLNIALLILERVLLRLQRIYLRLCYGEGLRGHNGEHGAHRHDNCQSKRQYRSDFFLKHIDLHFIGLVYYYIPHVKPVHPYVISIIHRSGGYFVNKV